MTSTIAESVILKTYGLGRVRTPLAQREALLDAYERSGLSGMKFAALHGVKYTSFANWVQQRNRHRLTAQAGACSEGGMGRTTVPAGSSVQWWEGVVDHGAAGTDGAAAGPGSGLQLHLPGGVRMEITGPDQVGWAAQLLQALAPGARGGGQILHPLRSC